MATKDLSIMERELINQSIEFIKSLAIKNPYMVKKYETVESAKYANYYLYIADYRDEINFEYFDYTIEDLKEIGITNRDLLKLLSENNNLIPEEYRYQLLENKLNHYEKDYVEQNDYFRMLSGLPSIDEIPANYIYVELQDKITKRTYTKPIHELTDEEYYQIEINGTYGKILEENPTKQYLYYIQPDKKISYYTARKTKDFYIMGYAHPFSDEYIKEFIDIYYEVLVYTMSVVYTRAHTDNDYYDSFIIMYMLTATLQKFFEKHIENLMQREVYDMETVKNIFASYGLPFFDNIPLKYQRKIVKNLNKLLSYKGTDKVFVDIADIFGFTDTELYKYYLVKDFVRDDSGKPISKDDTDLDKIELKFAQVSTSTNDLSSFLRSDFLYQTYDEVVSGDPYWGEQDAGEIDEELKDEIKTMEFNYLSTKYLGCTTVFNMSECAYETIYFFNYLSKLYKEGQIDHLYFYNTNMKDNGDPIFLYDAVTALYILLFRRFGYKDTLPISPTGVASVYGFSFDTDLDALKEYAIDNSVIDFEGDKFKYWWKEAKVEELLEVLELPNNPDKATLLDTYFSDKKIDNALEKLMLHTDNYRIYRALNAIHNYNMYSQSIKDIYGDYGTTEEFITFTNYLSDKDILLYRWVENNSYNAKGDLDKEKIIKAIDDMLDTLDMYFYSEEFNYLFTNMNVTLDLVRKYFLQMISIFKAYTVELKKMNIYYLFNDKFLNTIKLFSYIKMIVNTESADSIEKEMDDDISGDVTWTEKDKTLKDIEEFIISHLDLFERDQIRLLDKLIKHHKGFDADAIDIVDVFYTNSTKNLNDTNKIINGHETLQISYSYVD